MGLRGNEDEFWGERERVCGWEGKVPPAFFSSETSKRLLLTLCSGEFVKVLLRDAVPNSPSSPPFPVFCSIYLYLELELMIRIVEI